jgi:hypothetical protein
MMKPFSKKVGDTGRRPACERIEFAEFAEDTYSADSAIVQPLRYACALICGQNESLSGRDSLALDDRGGDNRAWPDREVDAPAFAE